jgi:protein MBA1
VGQTEACKHLIVSSYLSTITQSPERSHRTSHFSYKVWPGIYSKVPKLDRPSANPTIDSRTIVPKAKELHKELYTAFAEGDEKKLEEIAGETLFGTYKARLAKRKLNERVSWELVRYKGWTRKVSHVTMPYPIQMGGLPVGLQQAIVKIQSVQRIRIGRVPELAPVNSAKPIGRKKGAKETVVWGEPKEKTVTEYLVIQRQVVRGVQEPWHVWGFAKEFDLNELKEPAVKKGAKDTKNKKVQVIPSTN